MNGLKRWVGAIKQTKGLIVLPVGVAVLISILALQQPMGVYASIDPGLDSGNATVDRTSVPGQTILTYKTVGNSTFKAPAGVTDVRVIVVGGGGGGGAGELNSGGDGAGGGGAGEYVHQTSFSVTPSTAVTVTVGGGGAGSTTKQPDGGTTAQNGSGGSNSLFGSLTARGGGGGGGNDQLGLSGGSGGGAGGKCSNTNRSAGSSTAVNPGVGNAGGSNMGTGCGPRGGAGGGGAGAAGTNAAGSGGATGGAGLQNDITGASKSYAAGGGGGGGSNSGSGVAGGSSIGGNGGNASGGNGTNGSINTGSGGGGGGSSTSTSGGNGGTGGSGVVIVRFATQNTPDPGGATGLRMWYKADGAGNTNSQWNDASGFGYNMTQGTAAQQPVLTQNAINFNPAYVFDGSDDVFSLPTHGIAASESMSAFYAATSLNSAGGYRYLNEFGDDRPSISLNNGKPNLYVRDTSSVSNDYSTVETMSPRVYSFVSPNGGGQKVIGVNNKEQAWSITGNYTTGGGNANTTFGNRNVSSGTGWMGPIAEALYFNRQLTPQERHRVNSYLAIKYGVTLDQGASGTAYLASNDSTAWPADATFKNDIGGIGRDDGSTLNQKQSKSTNDDSLVTIGHGDIAANNQANANNFSADRSFLLWGNDGAATTQSTNVTGTQMQRIERIWKSVTTGTVGQVKVRIPTSTLDGINPRLLVSSGTTFDSSSQVVNMSTNGSNYEATVTLTGTQYFTFASMTGSDIEFVSKTATDAGGTPITAYTPGESMQYVLSIKNNGPQNAGTVTVSDTLPDGIVPVDATGGGWSCPINGQTVTCTRSALNSGITASDIIIEATIESNVTGQKVNTADASVTLDPNPNNNSGSLTMDPAPRADLSLSKEDTTPGNPTAGTDFDYKFTVTNNGPSDIASYSIADTLPADLSFVSASPDICPGSSGQTVTCSDTAGITNGESKEVTVTVHVDPGYNNANPLNNTATVSVPTGVTDPNTANNSSTNQTDVDVSADLTIDKSHTGNFIAGENNDYTITVNNAGPSAAPANSVTITDTLDVDFDYQSYAGTDWTCNEANGTVTCDYAASIASSAASSPLTLTVLVDPISKGNIDNTADVSSTAPDPNTGNNSDTDTVTVVSEADLGITKTHVDSTFTAGQEEQYEFEVTNNGPSADAPSFTVTDTLPASLSFVSTTGDASCSADPINAQLITCNGGGIAVGETLNFTMTVQVDGGATGQIDNSATVSVPTGTTDPNPANDTSNDTVNVTPNADLSITKDHTGDLTAGDTNAEYTITVTNNGPSNISSFTVTDTLNPNLTFVSGTGTGVTCDAPTQVVTCTGGAIANGGQVVITLTVTVAATATAGSTIDNTAAVEAPADVNDPNTANNSNTVSNTVTTSADLAITKSHTGDFTAGANTNEYTIEVTNNGPSDAASFTVTDTLPPEATYISADGTDVECQFADPTLTCTGGPVLSVGQTVSFTLTVGVDASQAGGSTFDNTASVASATPDPTPGNNNNTDTATVDTNADLSIEKTSIPEFTAGSNEDYTIKVKNDGPSDVSSFTVTDTLPAGLTFVSANPGICPGPGPALTCTGGALPAGEETTFTITVNVDSGVAIGTPIANTAHVEPPAGTTDQNMANNDSTDTINIVGVADLEATKANNGAFVAGETGQYTVTIENHGPTDVPGGDITVTDTLPDGMTFDSTPTAGWSCSGTTDISCTYANTLANGASAALDLNVAISSETQGEVNNSATVSAAWDDPNPDNNTGSDTTNATAEADLTATKQAQGPITAGKPVTYRFEITNNGPSVAKGLKITDDLQGNLTYQSVSDDSWSCNQNGTTLTCDYGFNLVVGESTTADVTFMVAQDAPNPLENTANVTFNGTDPTPANPSDSEPVSYEADLEVDIERESKVYHSGEQVLYTYIVKNRGPSAASDVKLTDTIPQGLTIDSVSKDEPGGTSILAALDTFFFPRAMAADNPFSCSLNGQDLTCNANTLMVGTYNLYVTAHIADGFTGNLANNVQITSSTPDPNPANNSASNTIEDVQPAEGLLGGLSETGQNLFLWIATGVACIAIATGWLLRRMRHKPAGI